MLLITHLEQYIRMSVVHTFIQIYIYSVPKFSVFLYFTSSFTHGQLIHWHMHVCFSNASLGYFKSFCKIFQFINVVAVCDV